MQAMCQMKLPCDSALLRVKLALDRAVLQAAVQTSRKIVDMRVKKHGDVVARNVVDFQIVPQDLLPADLQIGNLRTVRWPD